jgi:hypothetical protein
MSHILRDRSDVLAQGVHANEPLKEVYDLFGMVWVWAGHRFRLFPKSHQSHEVIQNFQAVNLDDCPRRKDQKITVVFDCVFQVYGVTGKPEPKSKATREFVE